MPSLLDILKNRIERLRLVHRAAMGAFHAYEQIQEYRNPITHSQTIAAQHAQDLGRYKGFMNSAEQALLMRMHIELAKLFDENPDALHIPKLVNATKASQTIILRDPANVDASGNPYPGLSNTEWREIENELAQAAPVIKLLKQTRNKEVAHLNLSARNNPTYNTYSDFIDLLELSEKILNKISGSFYGNTAYFGVLKNQIIDDSKALFELISKQREEDNS